MQRRAAFTGQHLVLMQFTKKAADFAIYASSFAWSYLIDRKHNVSVLKTVQWYMIKYNHVNYANNTSLKIYIGYTLV